MTYCMWARGPWLDLTKSWVYEWFSLVWMYGLYRASEASEPPTVGELDM